MNNDILKFPIAFDPRGDLLPIEMQDVPFQVNRLFIIINSPGRIARAEHFAGCKELAILIAGTVTFELGRAKDQLIRVELKNPGDAVLINPEDYVRYYLENADSKIAVLAEKPYSAALKGR